MYSDAVGRVVSVFDFDDRLAPVRTGRYAEATASLVWLLGLVAVAGAFWYERRVRWPVVDALWVGVALFAAGLLLGVVAPSVERAAATGFAFGVTVVVVGWLWSLAGASPRLFALGTPVVDALLSALLAVVVPTFVAAAVRAVG